MRLWEIPYSMFWKKRDNFQLVARILSDASNREVLMGVKRERPMTPEQYSERLNSDVGHIVRHSQTDDYAIWAKEAWSEFMNSLDAVMDPKTDPRQVDFHRGAMRKAIDLLRISYKVLDYKQEMKKESPKRDAIKII